MNETLKIFGLEWQQSSNGLMRIDKSIERQKSDWNKAWGKDLAAILSTSDLRDLFKIPKFGTKK